MFIRFSNPIILVLNFLKVVNESVRQDFASLTSLYVHQQVLEFSCVSKRYIDKRDGPSGNKVQIR